jgi:hypothetical protein
MESCDRYLTCILYSLPCIHCLLHFVIYALYHMQCILWELIKKYAVGNGANTGLCLPSYRGIQLGLDNIKSNRDGQFQPTILKEGAVCVGQNSVTDFKSEASN